MRIFFSAAMASTSSTHRLEAVASLKFLAIENMPPNFSAHVYGQTARWIRNGSNGRTEVSLGPRDIVLDGDWGPSCPLRKGALQPSLFGPLPWPTSPQVHILPVTRIVD